MESSNPTNISDIPDEILEYILSQLSPYCDLFTCRLVCIRWHSVISGIIQKKYINFQQCIQERTAEWTKLAPTIGPTITDRYSHVACYFDKSLYVFGGYASTNTTFNDLWRLDLATREWVRPLAMGSYPPPKACCSLVAFQDKLILFGGWSHPTPYPLHQAGRFFNEVHTYRPCDSSWKQSVTTSGPVGTAGHAASVLGHHMVIFGGSHGHAHSTNEIWVLNLGDMVWNKKTCRGIQPLPRYGHTQVVLDDNHIAVIGGCRGPNMRFSDVWILGLEFSSNLVRWKQMEVLNTDHAAPQLWCHPGCKVGSCVAFLSKSTKASEKVKSKPSFPVKTSRTPMCNQQRAKSVVIQPTMRPRPNHVGASMSPSSKQPSTSRSIPGKHGLDSSSDSDEGSIKRPTDLAVGELNIGPTRKRGAPGIRPNPRNDRQRQLQMLSKYEEKLKQRALPKPSPSVDQRALPKPSPSVDTGKNVASASSSVDTRTNVMQIFVLDLSEALTSGMVSWLPVREQSHSDIPEETILYSVNEARGELIVFGGIQADLNSMQRGMNVNSQIVTKDTYFINSRTVLN